MWLLPHKRLIEQHEKQQQFSLYKILDSIKPKNIQLRIDSADSNMSNASAWMFR